jgi:hypothetical protein
MIAVIFLLALVIDILFTHYCNVTQFAVNVLINLVVQRHIEVVIRFLFHKWNVNK